MSKKSFFSFDYLVNRLIITAWIECVSTFEDDLSRVWYQTQLGIWSHATGLHELGINEETTVSDTGVMQ